ncbi:MAG TPA: carboxylesterase family protein [Bryobacteraceae bacterium]|nr:carboxylesterase family protein [Bryobacteraceae bacterium]
MTFTREDRNAISRRRLVSAMAAGLCSSVAARRATAAEQSPVVETQSGRLRGASIDGVSLFRGIPYGGPTEGARRFLPPSKAATWTGIRDATRTGPRCVQGSGNIFRSPLIGEYFAGGRADRIELSAQEDSENCLNLNVLTPGLQGRRAVMVYIHGGGLTSGSDALTLFSDRFVREQDIVLVGVNHRLSVFGYTYLGAFSPKYAVGNVGQLDLIAALEWVRDNISHFGGDPRNVTIFGESGGGAKISALMAMPAARGLFHKACVQSGSALQASTADPGAESARRMLSNLGLGEKQADELQRVPVDKLLASLGGRGPAIVVDGHSLPHQTWEVKAPEESREIPMIIGGDKDESSLFSLQDKTLFTLDQAGLRARLVQAGIPESKVDGLLALYRRDHPADSPTDLYFRISTDRGARHNAVRQAELKAEQGKANVYMYYCQWDTPLAQGEMRIKSFHTSDLPLTMRLVLFPESDPLSRQLSGAWATFARTGNPSQKGLPWPAYTLTERTTMVFDARRSKAVSDPDRDERLALANYPSGNLL